MPKNTRNRHLAKHHARRQEQRRQEQRRRQTRTIAVALVIALVGGIAAFVAFVPGDDEPSSAATGGTAPTGSTGPTGATAEPGSQIGTVQPEPGPEEVACGGEQPPKALRPKPQFASPGEVVERGQTYTAEIETSCGPIVVELLAGETPETVNSFVFLAQQGFFDGQRIHRLDESLDVVQGGDPTGVGNGGPGYTIPDELTGDEVYEAGVLAMANSGAPDTGGSQFFFVTGPDASGLPPELHDLRTRDRGPRRASRDPAGADPGPRGRHRRSTAVGGRVPREGQDPRGTLGARLAFARVAECRRIALKKRGLKSHVGSSPTPGTIVSAPVFNALPLLGAVRAGSPRTPRTPTGRTRSRRRSRTTRRTAGRAGTGR